MKHRLPDIGVITPPENFKYEEVMEDGKPEHHQDYFAARHPHMNFGKRAKIFAPFAALKGFEEELQSREIRYERKRILDPDELYELNEALNTLHEEIRRRKAARRSGVKAEVEYFVICEEEHCEAYHRRGRYLTVRDTVWKVDVPQQKLKIGDLELPFQDIFRIRLIEETDEEKGGI